jgi:hypothetical protein
MMFRSHCGWNYVLLGFVVATAFIWPSVCDGDETTAKELLRPDNLVAWCIVPFDASKRTPQQRAEMVHRLGLKRVAYDWRQEHVAEFEEEILQYKQHQIEFFAFWSWHDSIEPLIRKHGLHPQIWSMMPNPKAAGLFDQVQEAAEAILPLAKKTSSIGCRLGLYIDGFREHLTAMLPHLICLNINGMAAADVVRGGRDKILTVGQGQHEVDMLRVVLKSGYSGCIGILDHRSDRDTEEVLRENLAGLEVVRQSLSE